MLEMLAFIHLIASSYGIDPRIAISIAEIESNLNPKAIGDKGKAIGLFQIQYKKHNLKRKDLLNEERNIIEGVRLLRFFKDRCKHRSDSTWIICYNMGIVGGSKVRYPKKQRYYKRFLMSLKKRST